MLKRFNVIRDHLLFLAYQEGAVVSIDRTITFRNQATKFERMFGPIHAATLLLQTKGKSLADCRDFVDTLIDAVEIGRRADNSTLYQ